MRRTRHSLDESKLIHLGAHRCAHLVGMGQITFRQPPAAHAFVNGIRQHGRQIAFDERGWIVHIIVK